MNHNIFHSSITSWHITPITIVALILHIDCACGDLYVDLSGAKLGGDGELSRW